MLPTASFKLIMSTSELLPSTAEGLPCGVQWATVPSHSFQLNLMLLCPYLGMKRTLLVAKLGLHGVMGRTMVASL